MDVIVERQFRDFFAVDENPHAGEVVGVVDQRRDWGPD
jgi:hypothetical protein